MHSQLLDCDGWTVRAVGDLSGVPERVHGQDVPATVPGCVHLDLIRAGLLRHPNEGYAERDQEWVGQTDWRYELRFTVDAELSSHRSVLLSFSGLDTAARVELNGEFIGRANNAFVTTTLDATGAVFPGTNVLAVVIAAPIPLAARRYEQSGKLPYNGDELGWHPFQMMRKPACNFGWDWGPRVATSGIMGSVRLDCWNEPWTRVLSPRIARGADGRWVIEFRAEFSESAPKTNAVTLTRAGGGGDLPFGLREELEGGALHYRLEVEEPELWWPHGYGAQAMYDLGLSFHRGGEIALSSWRIGFRTVELDTSADDAGSACTLRVNGEAVFCRGANWIPDTLFPTEATADRVRQRVRQAVDANMNMLRVWGGGLYEQEAFYEVCDELGVLVWQDFMFACALYAEDDLRTTIAEEASEQIDRLAPHPSVVVWCGGNECVEAYQHWGWKSRVRPGVAWGMGLWTELLPGLVGRLDPDCPYWPNSPWSGAVEDVRDPGHGDRHTWDLQFEAVRSIVPRFVSEFGRVAPACERTLWEAGVFEGVEGAETWPSGAVAMSHELREALEHRLRQTGGSSVAYDPVLSEHFGGTANDLRAWLWQTQVLQARALTTHIEWLRANSPRCMGALLWQLNDCWACQSWAIVDHGGRRKPAWYSVRRAFEPRLLTIQPLGGDGRLSAVLVNDTGEAFEGECVVRRVSFEGEELARAAGMLEAAPRGVARLDGLTDLVGVPEDAASELLVVSAGGMEARWFWARDRELRLPENALRVKIEQRDGGLVVALKAVAIAREIVIAADLLGGFAAASENAFTMLAGEEREIEIERGDAGLAAGVELPHVVRHAAGPASPG